MEERKYFWTMKNGEKINVDDMTESHLRNVLKLLIRRSKEEEKSFIDSEDKTPYCDDWIYK